jgi:dTDP-4-dehydrorhamnose reductase
VRILILGGTGQVGRELVALADPSPHELLSPPRAVLDVVDGRAVMAYFREHSPEICLNVAAYTDVAKAEQDPDGAFRANCKGAAYVADAAAALKIPLIHVSTDYVFDGQVERPYREEDPTRPINVYGASKLAGEQEVRNRCREHLIIRTSWVFSRWRRNFVKTIVEQACATEDLFVVNDEFGGPTSAADLAAAMLQLIELHNAGAEIPWGVYHCANRGSTSRYELAERILSRLRNREGETQVAKLTPVSTGSRSTPVSRPAYSVLDVGRMERLLGVRLRSWTEAVDEVVEELLASRFGEGSP